MPPLAVPPTELSSNLRLVRKFCADDDHRKLSCMVGEYHGDDGKLFLLPVVAHVEAQLAVDVREGRLYHEYMGDFLGMPEFRNAAAKVVLGSDSLALAENRVLTAQTFGGGGALRVGFEYIKRRLGYDTVYVSEDNWENHERILAFCGIKTVRRHRYYDASTGGVQFEAMLSDLRQAPAQSVVLLQACAHNPTGADLTPDQWRQVADLVEEKDLFPFLDLAYQGMASGDPEKDAFAVRLFEQRGFDMMVSVSFCKNFGLYSDRPGALIVVSRNKACLAGINAFLAYRIIRPGASEAGQHGAVVVTRILNDPQLKAQWLQQVRQMAERIKHLRIALADGIERRLGESSVWSRLVRQKGFFSLPPLTTRQIEYIAEQKHIYMFDTGRANLAALGAHKIDYFVEAICEAVKATQ